MYVCVYVFINKIDFFSWGVFGLDIIDIFGMFYVSMGLLIEPNWIPLRTLLSSRIVASAVVEKMGMEVVNDNFGINVGMNLVNFMAQQCYSCKSYDLLSLSILFAGILILRNNGIVGVSNAKRIESMDDDFSVIRKNVSDLVWVILIVFTKNIENAL